MVWSSLRQKLALSRVFMKIPNKVLLLTTNHVGNNLICTPAIRLLKKHNPHATLDVVVMSTRGADTFCGNPDIHKIYATRRKNKIQKLVKEYPLVIGLHHDKAKEYLTAENKHAIVMRPYTNNKHRADDTLDFVRGILGCDLEEDDRRYVLCPTQHDFAIIKKMLGNRDNKILIGLHLGSGRTANHGWKIWYSKRDKDPRIWPLGNYIALAKQLQACNPNVKFVLTGSRNEKFLSKPFIKAIPDTINLIGKTSLQQMTALMQYLSLFITQDTGPLHVASATNISLISMFGITNPLCTGPYPVRPQHTIIKKTAVNDITPTEVYQAVLGQLSLA